MDQQKNHISPSINMFIKIDHISKSFGSQQILQDVSLQLRAHDTLSILGKSGCGKTTLLKIIAGLLQPDNGDIIINDILINDTIASKRDIVYIFQEPLLFPHLNVFDNIAFGLKLRSHKVPHINETVSEMINELQLNGHENKMPDQLSGGQKQRVAFGRAIIIKPKLLLLDEPFGNLDTETRATMQVLFKQICGTFGITSLFVTHDLKEALLMGDKFGYMEHGNLKIFDNKNAFINDTVTGVQDEIDFWKNL